MKLKICVLKQDILRGKSWSVQIYIDLLSTSLLYGEKLLKAQLQRVYVVLPAVRLVLKWMSGKAVSQFCRL